MVKFLKILLVITSFLGIIFLIFFQKKNTDQNQIICDFYAQHCGVEGFSVVCAGWDRNIILTWKDREEYIKCLIYNK